MTLSRFAVCLNRSIEREPPETFRLVTARRNERSARLLSGGTVEVHGTKAEEKVEVHQNEQPKQIQPENQEYSALADLGKIQQ